MEMAKCTMLLNLLNFQDFAKKFYANVVIKKRGIKYEEIKIQKVGDKPTSYYQFNNLYYDVNYSRF